MQKNTGHVELTAGVCLKETDGEGHFVVFDLSLERKLPGQRQSFTQKVKSTELGGKEFPFA